CLVELGPEQGHQRVATMRAARGGEGEVGEESQALGLRQDRLEPPPVGGDELDLAEGAQLDHAAMDGRSNAERPGNGRGTLTDRTWAILRTPRGEPAGDPRTRRNGSHAGS